MKITALLCLVLALLAARASSADAPLSAADRARDPRFAELADAHHAYRVGAALGSLPMNFITGTPATTKVVADMKKLAGELAAMRASGGAESAFALPDPPARSGDPESDYAAIMKYFGTCEQQIRKAIGPAKPSPGMPDARACFELGWGAPQWVFAYGAGMEKLRDSFEQNLPRTAQKSGLPAELWQPLFDQARAKVPRDDFAATYRKTYEGIDRFFRKTAVVHRRPQAALAELREAKQGWLAGLAIGRAAQAFLAEDLKTAEMQRSQATEALRKMEDVAEGAVSVSLPKIPAPGSRRQVDVRLAFEFVQQSERALTELGDEFGALTFDPMTWIQLGARTGLARGLSGARLTVDFNAALDYLAEAARVHERAEEKWQPFLARARSGASAKERDQALADFIAYVSQALEAEEKRLSATQAISVARKSAAEPPKPDDSLIKIGPDGQIITPQGEIDPQGNIIVPGLGGMKFTPNGDIFGGKGEKLFDGKTGVWAKDSRGQTASVPPVLLGETSAQLTARLGKPEVRGSSSVFRQGEWAIIVEFHADRAENVVWRKSLGSAGKFTSGALYAMARDPEPDLQALRRLHAGDKPWEEIGRHVVVIQKGGVVRRRIADYKPDAKELADRSLLHLPDITWTTGTLRFNFTVSESDGKLDKVLRATTEEYENRERAKRPVGTEK